MVRFRMHLHMWPNRTLSLKSQPPVPLTFQQHFLIWWRSCSSNFWRALFSSVTALIMCKIISYLVLLSSGTIFIHIYRKLSLPGCSTCSHEMSVFTCTLPFEKHQRNQLYAKSLWLGSVRAYQKGSCSSSHLSRAWIMNRISALVAQRSWHRSTSVSHCSPLSLSPRWHGFPGKEGKWGQSVLFQKQL